MNYTGENYITGKGRAPRENRPLLVAPDEGRPAAGRKMHRVGQIIWPTLDL
jgi:hypothetical protein